MKRTYSLVFLSTLIIYLITSCSGNLDRKKTNEVMNMKRHIYGETEGKQIYQYTFNNEHGMSVSIINYGGIVTHLLVPDKKGNMADIALGYDSLSSYIENNNPHFGGIIGRYANRIAMGKFMLDGNEYQLATNDGLNHIHGGIKGLDKVVWDVKDFIYPDSAGLILTYLSQNGEEGYPGNLNISVTYTLTNNNELKIYYDAFTDKPTPINLTHHSYFNLAGQNSGTIYDHWLQINSKRFVPVNANLIPTGELAAVEGTPMDFQIAKPIGKDIDKVEGGFDHTFVFDNSDNLLKMVAQVNEPKSGRIMRVFTDQPGMQFYSGNFLDGSYIGKGGVAYHKHFGFCLETQHFPDSPNQPGFPSTILRPDEHFRSSTIYWFGTEK